MKKILPNLAILILLVSIIAVSLTGCGSGKNSTKSASKDAGIESSEDAVVIQIGYADPAGEYSRSDYLIQAANGKLQESLGGKVVFEGVPSGQLGNETDMLNGCSDGSVEAALLSVDTFSNQVPMLQLYTMPYLTNYYEQCFVLLDSDYFWNKTLDTFENDWNIHPLGGYSYNGPRMLTATKPIRSLEDCKDVVVRITTNQIAQKVWEALGANPTVVAFSECYTAFSQGVVDGIDCPVDAQYMCAFYEPAKYLDFTDEYDVLSLPMINLDLWNSFSQDEQKAISEAFEYGVEYERKHVLEVMDKVTEMMTDGTVASLERCDIDRNEFKIATLSVHEEYYDKLGSELFDWAYEELDKDNAAKDYPLWKDLATWSNYASK